MAQFIALHNIELETADHLSELLIVRFPDTKIANDFACKNTKTKAIVCDAPDSHFKEPINRLSQWCNS